MNKNLISIYSISLLSMVGVFVVSPGLPIIAEALSLQPADIGYIITSFTLGNVLVVSFIGIVADKIGRRKVVVPSLYIFGIAGLLSGAADSLGWLLFWRFVQGMGSAAFGTLTVAMISDIYEGPERVRYFSYNMVVSSVGMTISPLLGGILVLYSWRYPFFIGAIAIPFALFAQCFLRYEEKLSTLDTKAYLNNFFLSLKSKRVLLAAYLNFSVFVMLGGAFLTFYALYCSLVLPETIPLAGVDWSREVVIGAVVSVFSIMVGVMSSRLGAIHRRFGFNRVLCGAFFSYAGALLLFQATDSLLIMLLSIMWLGCAHGLVVPSIIALFTKIAPDGMVGAYITVNSLVFRLGQTLGPLLMSLVYIYLGIRAVFVVAALIAVPAGIVAYTTQWRKPIRVEE